LPAPGLTSNSIYGKAVDLKAEEGTRLDEIASFWLEVLGIEKQEPLKDAPQKIKKIIEGLTKERCLLFLDNLEDILHPASHHQAGKTCI